LLRRSTAGLELQFHPGLPAARLLLPRPGVHGTGGCARHYRRRLPTVPPEDADRDDAGSGRADARVLCAVALGRSAVDRPRLACRRHPAARRGRTQYPDVDVARARTDRGRAADRATALGRVHRAPTRRRGRDGGERLMSVLIVLVVMLTLLLIRVPV